MEPKNYTVVRIDGEYAYLHEDGGAPDSELYIALALLPVGIDVGTRMRYEFPEFTVI